MYEELISRLRAGEYTLEELSIILPKAADAIEELLKAAKAMHTMPAIYKAVPVPPHGRWNNIIQGIIPSGQCSNCGAWDKVTRFCPNCGSQMDGE